MPGSPIHVPATTLRPEAALLLGCAHTGLDCNRSERIRKLLGQDIDWVYLIKTALAHGMLPLLYWNLNRTCPEAVPKATLDQFASYFHAHAERNLLLSKELLKLLELLGAHGIPAIPFKGPVLAATVYGNLSLRQFYDLDILVKRKDVERAKELIILQKYQPQTMLTDEQEREHLKSNNVYPLVRDDGRVIVELHWRITMKYFSFPLATERLFERLEPVSFDGGTVNRLSPEDLLLILCVHGSKHAWRRLDWICDISELLCRYQKIDFELVMERARRLGVERMLFLGLFLATDLLEASLPEPILQRLQTEPVVKLLAAKVTRQLFPEADDLAGGFENPVTGEGILMSSVHFHLQSRERLQDRGRYCLHILRLALTPTKLDQSWIRLPGALSFLYFLVRPIRLTRDYGLLPLRHFRQVLKSLFN